MIARKSVVILLAQAGTLAGGWLSIWFMARTYGLFADTVLGYIGFGLAFVSMFYIIADMGIGAAHVKRVSEGADIAECNGIHVMLKLSLILVMSTSVVIAINAWTRGKTDFESSEQRNVVYLMTLYFALLSLSTIPNLTFKAKLEIAKSSTITIVEIGVRTCFYVLAVTAGVVGVMQFAPGLDFNEIPAPVEWPGFLAPIQESISSNPVTAIALAYVIGGLAAVVAGFWLLGSLPMKRPNKALTKSYLSFAVPWFFAFGIALMLVSLDRVIINYFWQGSDVGQYQAALQCALVITALSSALGLLFMPSISSMNAKQERGEICELVRRSERYLAMFGFLFMAVVFAMPGNILGLLFNPTFEKSAATLVLLAAYASLVAMNTPYMYALGGLDRPKDLTKVSIATFACGASTMLILIPPWSPLEAFGIIGPTGAATGLAASTVLAFALYRHYCTKAGIRWENGTTIGKYSIAMVVAFLPVYFLNMEFPAERWFLLIGYSGLGLAIYAGMLRVLGELKNADVRFFLDTISPGGLAKYFRAEMKEK